MQSLLNIKEKLEEQAKTAYGLARMTLNEEEAKLAELIARKAARAPNNNFFIFSLLSFLFYSISTFIETYLTYS